MGVQHSDAAVGDRSTNRARLIGPMYPVHRVPPIPVEIQGSRAQGVGGPTGDTTSVSRILSGLPPDHIFGWGPAWPFGLTPHLGRSRPGQSGAAHAYAIAAGEPEVPDEIEKTLSGIDHDRAGRIPWKKDPLGSVFGIEAKPFSAPFLSRFSQGWRKNCRHQTGNERTTFKHDFTFPRSDVFGGSGEPFRVQS